MVSTAGALGGVLVLLRFACARARRSFRVITITPKNEIAPVGAELNVPMAGGLPELQIDFSERKTLAGHCRDWRYKYLRFFARAVTDLRNAAMAAAGPKGTGLFTGLTFAGYAGPRLSTFFRRRRAGIHAC
jgi:hypothetical protein